MFILLWIAGALVFSWAMSFALTYGGLLNTSSSTALSISFFVSLVVGAIVYLVRTKTITYINKDDNPVPITDPPYLTYGKALGMVLVPIALVFGYYNIWLGLDDWKTKNKPQTVQAQKEADRLADYKAATRIRCEAGIKSGQECNNAVANGGTVVAHTEPVVVAPPQTWEAWFKSWKDWVLVQFYSTADFVKIPLIILALLVPAFILMALVDSPKKFLRRAIAASVALVVVWLIGTALAEDISGVQVIQKEANLLPVSMPQTIIPVVQRTPVPLIKRVDASDLTYDIRWHRMGHVLKNRVTLSLSGFDLRNPESGQPCLPSGCDEQQIGGKLYAEGKHMAILVRIGDNKPIIWESGSSMELDPEVYGYGNEVLISVNQVMTREAWENMLGGFLYQFE